jgi:hypothetical protein
MRKETMIIDRNGDNKPESRFRMRDRYMESKRTNI